MYKLPFIIPDEKIELNLTLLLMIIDSLSSTSRGKKNLNNERLLVYFYLIKNPHNLNKLLVSLSKKNINLKSYELLSYKAENQSLETLYDMSTLKKYRHSSGCGIKIESQLLIIFKVIFDNVSLSIDFILFKILIDKQSKSIEQYA